LGRLYPLRESMEWLLPSLKQSFFLMYDGLLMLRVVGCLPSGEDRRGPSTTRAGVVQASREETAEWTGAVGTAAMAMGFVGVKLG